MNILILLPPILAPVICSTALIRCIKKQVPGAKLHVLIPAPLAHWLSTNPYIDQLLAAQNIHTHLVAAKYTALIDLAALEENKHWAEAAGVPYLSHTSSSLFYFLQNFFGGRQKQHLALLFVAAAKALGIQYDGNGLEVYMPENEKVTQQDIPTAHSAGYVAFALGDKLPLRDSIMAQVCRELQFPIMFTGSSARCEAVDALAQTDRVKVYNACGKFSDGETADLLRRSRLVVSADESWLQVAAAFGKPTLIVQQEQWGMLLPPLYAKKMLQQEHLPYATLPVGTSSWTEPAKKKAVPEKDKKAVSMLLALVEEQLGRW